MKTLSDYFDDGWNDALVDRYEPPEEGRARKAYKEGYQHGRAEMLLKLMNA